MLEEDWDSAAPGGDSLDFVRNGDVKDSDKDDDHDDTVHDVPMVRGSPAGLSISVSDPEKHGDGMDAYATYSVATSSLLPKFKSSEFTVRRRYKDFVLLRSKLMKEFPNCVIPPLPEKHKAKHLDRFGSEFLEKRRRFLEIFTLRLQNHSQLSHSEDLHTFLEQEQYSETSTKEGGFFSGISDKASSAYASFKLKNPDERFLNLKTNVASAQDGFDKLEKTSSKTSKCRKEFATEFSEYNATFEALAESDKEFHDPLIKLSQSMDQLGEIAKESAELEETILADNSRDWSLYAGAAAELLKKHEIFEQAFEAAQDLLAKRETERDEVEASTGGKSFGSLFTSKDPTTVKQERLEKLAIQIQDCEKDVVKKEDELKVSNREVIAEMNVWTHDKLDGLRSMLVDYANSQIAYHSKSMAMWQDILPIVENIRK